ncbi:ephrin-B2-like isoform X1 [Vespa mandarinia]|uniref:ephrin-B2 n=1 Tax=Vespa crabro TaxID=7445 RepID=UPI001617F9BD|nr:ephrin-B2-like isoform X1 [Vespa mandarinia]XP_046826007.1 ephrin-B2 [Vespa crabro]XP_047355157.1 ephrin-B2 [Vespa velutina]
MVSKSFMTLVFLVCLQTVLLSTVSNCAKAISLYWNTTNSIFRIDNTDHIIDVNKNNAVFEYDQVNIICPMYKLGTYDPEKYLIYNVSKEEYETCRITNPNPRLIAICDKPYEDKYYTITFRPFTPQPGGLEFLPGHDYYFISTSSKEDLHKRIGGRCTSDNMKVVFKVCCSNDTSSSSATSRNNSVAVTSSTVPSSSSTSTAVLGGGAGGMMPPPPPPSVLKGGERFYPGGNIHHHRDHHQPATVMPTHVPPSALYPVHPHQPQPPIHNGPPSVSSPPKTSIGQKKKNKEYSDHPNEVVKNEELTYNGATSYGFGQVLFLMVSSVLISVLMPQLLR